MVSIFPVVMLNDLNGTWELCEEHFQHVINLCGDRMISVVSFSGMYSQTEFEEVATEILSKYSISRNVQGGK